MKPKSMNTYTRMGDIPTKTYYGQFNATEDTYTRDEYISMWIGAIIVGALCIGITIGLAGSGVNP